MAKTTLGRGGRTMAGPGSQELIRMLAGNGADPALIAKLGTNRPGVVNTFDPAVFQQAAATATANLEREAAERRAMAEDQLRRDQLAQQAAQANMRGRLDYAKANADNRLQTRAQGFREQQSQIDNRYRDRAFDATDARQQEELGLRRQNQFFQQDMTLAELEMKKREAETADKRYQQDFGLRERAANLNELTSKDAMRLNQLQFGLAETREGKRFSDQQQATVDWKVESAKAMEAETAEMFKAARAMSLNPEGRREFAKLAEERRAILAAKGDMTPDQFSQMMGQLTQRFAAADLSSYEVQPPSIDERIAQSYRVLPNDMAVLVQPDGKMQLLDGRSKGGAQVEAARLRGGESQPPMTAEQHWQSLYGGSDAKATTQFNKDYAEAERRLQQEWSSKEENLDALVPPRMPGEQVIAEMQRMLALQRGSAMQQAAPGTPQAAAQTANPAGQMSPLGDTGMAAPGTPAAPDPMADLVEKTPEQIESEWFAADPKRAKLRDAFDQQMALGDQALPAFRDLSEALAGSKKQGHPAKYIHPKAILELHNRGVENTMSAAAESVAQALRDGSKHYALMQPHEQAAMDELDVLDETNPEEGQKIRSLPPGTFYLDPTLRLHRVPPLTTTESASGTIQKVAGGLKTASDAIDDIFSRASAWMSSSESASSGTSDRVKRRGSPPPNKVIPGRKASPGTTGRTNNR